MKGKVSALRYEKGEKVESKNVNQNFQGLGVGESRQQGYKLRGSTTELSWENRKQKKVCGM